LLSYINFDGLGTLQTSSLFEVFNKQETKRIEAYGSTVHNELVQNLGLSGSAKGDVVPFGARSRGVALLT
jgi:hypothetical protein